MENLRFMVKGEGMEHLNVAIADDNERILNILDDIISADKNLNLGGNADLIRPKYSTYYTWGFFYG